MDSNAQTGDALPKFWTCRGHEGGRKAVPPTRFVRIPGMACVWCPCDPAAALDCKPRACRLEVWYTNMCAALEGGCQALWRVVSGPSMPVWPSVSKGSSTVRQTHNQSEYA